MPRRQTRTRSRIPARRSAPDRRRLRPRRASGPRTARDRTAIHGRVARGLGRREAEGSVARAGWRQHRRRHCDNGEQPCLSIPRQWTASRIDCRQGRTVDGDPTGQTGGMGPPITFMLDNKQYVAVAGGQGAGGGGRGAGAEEMRIRQRTRFCPGCTSTCSMVTRRTRHPRRGSGGCADGRPRAIDPGAYCTLPKKSPSGVAGAVNCFTTFSVSGSRTLT